VIAGTYSSPQGPPTPDLLGELLHSLSQPLTTLRCSLELSIEELSDDEIWIKERAETQRRSVSVALQQTDRVIAMIQLMREYIDAGQCVPQVQAAALAPAIRGVVEEYSSIAAVRGIQMRLVGQCAATLPLAESRLWLALSYLIGSMIEAQPAPAEITLLLGEGPAGAVFRVEPTGRGDSFDLASASASGSTLRRVRLAVAGRILDAAGASLVLREGDEPGFVLRVPPAPQPAGPGRPSRA